MHDLIDSKNKILKVAGILYLVGKVTKTEQKNISKLLKINKKQMDDILSGLQKQNLIYKNRDLVIFTSVKDEFKIEVGLSLLYEIISKIDLDQIFQIFPEQKQRIEIYKNLSKARHPLVSKYFNKQADEILKHV